MNTEGKTGWEEIADSRLEGKFDVQELNQVASLAYKCINRVPRKRPSMRDVVQVLSRILTSRRNRKHHESQPSAADDVSIDTEQTRSRISVSDHRREESMDSAIDIYDV